MAYLPQRKLSMLGTATAVPYKSDTPLRVSYKMIEARTRPVAEFWAVTETVTEFWIMIWSVKRS